MTQLTVANALATLQEKGSLFEVLFETEAITVEFYKPDKVDLQQPHTRNELYIVAAGSGTFLNGQNTVAFQQGDILFVPAGVEHRFEQFSDDFATWVLFFGDEKL